MTRAADPPTSADVLVVGGGPAGAAAARHLASAGHHVVVVERRVRPVRRPGTAILAPRALAELRTLGAQDRLLESVTAPQHLSSIRFVSGGRSIERPWPSHPDLPAGALSCPRHVLDEVMLALATDAGAVVLDGAEAVAPVIERGFVRGASVQSADGTIHPLEARYTVVADGADSRFGRALGTHRRPDWPVATAIRGTWATTGRPPTSLSIHLDLPGTDDRLATGYGWVVPADDRAVDIGVGVLSTGPDSRSVNTAHLLSRFVAGVADELGVDPGAPLDPPTGGRLPLGASVGPAAGPLHLVVGDAAGLANPMTGAGIEEALASGRTAGQVLDQAVRERDPTVLQRYPDLLDRRLGTYFKIGRLLDRAAGRPTVLDWYRHRVTASPRLADASLRIATRALHGRRPGPAEWWYRGASAVSVVAPEA